MAGAAAGPPCVLGNLGWQQRGGDCVWLVRCLLLTSTAVIKRPLSGSCVCVSKPSLFTCKPTRWMVAP